MRPRGLRWRLTVSGATILIAAFAAAAVAVYRGTGADLRGQLDHELRIESDAFARGASQARARDPRALAAAASTFIQTQPYHATTRLLFATVTGARTATNEAEFLGARPEPGESVTRQEHENSETQRLLVAPPGLSTVRLPDIGSLRLLVRRVTLPRLPPLTIGVGVPLESVETAQHGVAQTLAIAGGLTLVLALLATFLLASGHSRPLRRMVRTAALIDDGDLTPRVDLRGTRDETRVLALALNHMLDRLAEAFARQGRFISDASHELRTPLTVIGGQMELLAQEPAPPPEEVRRTERAVHVEVERMTRIVDDLLTLARSDEPQFIRREPINLPVYLADLTAPLTCTTARRFDVGPVSDGLVNGDPHRLAQALRNVLRNAIDHTAAGGLVRLSTSTVATKPGWIRIVIDDDGPGIPADHRARVFDRFYRTDLARARAHGGSGIGLAIVRAVIEAHGGAVKATNSPDGGARIELELPGFVPAESPTISPTAPGADRVTSPTPERSADDIGPPTRGATVADELPP